MMCAIKSDSNLFLPQGSCNLRTDSNYYKLQISRYFAEQLCLSPESFSRPVVLQISSLRVHTPRSAIWADINAVFAVLGHGSFCTNTFPHMPATGSHTCYHFHQPPDGTVGAAFGRTHAAISGAGRSRESEAVTQGAHVVHRSTYRTHLCLR